MRAMFVLGLVLAIPGVASAQRWGRERFPQSGACFYRHLYFEGDYFCVRAGDEVPKLPGDLNDEISSVLVFGRTDVTVFKDTGFRGGSERFDYSVDDLNDYGWNDRISSVQVRPAKRPDRYGDLNDDQRGRDRRGEDPDRIVRRAYQDILGRAPDEAGLRQYRSRIIDDGWNEEQVRTSLRNSPEYREKTTMTRAKAEGIVRSAYLAVLKREPDAEGSAGYVNSVLRDNWSQQDVERELRKSEEFRTRR